MTRYKQLMKASQRAIVQQALAHCGGDRKAAAIYLGVNDKFLRRVLAECATACECRRMNRVCDACSAMRESLKAKAA